MRTVLKMTCVGCVLAVMNSPAVAGEAEFAITHEFISVCNAKTPNIESVGERFDALDWSETDAEMTELLEPSDFLTALYESQGYSVALDNGAEWYGVTSRGKLNSYKITYCGLIAIDDDPSGYKEDFEKATGLVVSDSNVTEIENRFVYAETGGDFFYVMREIRSDEVSYFIYGKAFVTP